MRVRWRANDDDLGRRAPEHIIEIREHGNLPPCGGGIAPPGVEIATANHAGAWNTGQRRQVEGLAGVAEANDCNTSRCRHVERERVRDQRSSTRVPGMSMESPLRSGDREWPSR